jgi:FkbM family methyltransferase
VVAQPSCVPCCPDDQQKALHARALRVVSVLTKVKRLLVGTSLERPARALMALDPRRTVRKNHRDDEALRTLIRSLPADAGCVDVGANVGYILDAMVAGCPQGRHIAFEPVPALAESLRTRFPRVDVRAQAVADAPGRTSFTLVPDRPSRSGISATLDLSLNAAVEEIEVEVTTLDDALPAGFRPALIKVDVEGGELEALLGARRVLTEHRPLLAIEHQYGRRSDVDRTRRIHDLLTELDYDLRTVDGVALDRRRFADLVAAGEEWNFLARPH